jgi:hypothetical protein
MVSGPVKGLRPRFSVPANHSSISSSLSKAGMRSWIDDISGEAVVVIIV